MKQTNVQRRHLILGSAALGAIALTACTTTGTESGDPADRRKAIDAGAESALSRLYAQHPGSRELVNSAVGILVFPSFVSGGFILAGGSGQGVLREKGKSAGYFRMTEASVGLLAGAQSQAVFILFMTTEALNRFKSSNGWTVGADAQVTMISVGANATVNTTTTGQQVIGFVMTNGGLMGGVSLNGNRITPLGI